MKVQCPFILLNVNLLHARDQVIECLPGIYTMIVHDEYATTIHDKHTQISPKECSKYLPDTYFYVFSSLYVQ